MVLLPAILMTTPAWGQEAAPPEPLDGLLDVFEAPEGAEFVPTFARQPIDGVTAIDDPIGDFVHATGLEPGFTPDHIDITGVRAVVFDPGPIDLFTSTEDSQIWAARGFLEIDLADHEPFATYTGEQIHDGSQYENGAYLFEFTLAGTPPFQPPGRCEYVVWINDSQRGETFVNNPSFPLDPAAGTNLAVGLGLNPVEGPGTQSGFALELNESGGFAPIFEADVRAFVTPGHVGVTVPADLIGELAGANFYTFCVNEGIDFEPGVSGADQTGFVEMTTADFGAVRIETREVPAPPTTTTTTATTTTTTVPTPTTTSLAADLDGTTEREDERLPWWILVTTGGIGIALAGWWLYRRDTDPCAELAEVWADALRDCEKAGEAADEATALLEEAEREVERLETERSELCKTWPPACWDSEEGESMEDGRGHRMTQRDIHMRKVALGQVWADYKTGRLSATEVEEQWRRMDTPEFREDMRQADLKYKALLDQKESEIERAVRRVEEARSRSITARQRAGEACTAAEEAKVAYQKCGEER